MEEKSVKKIGSRRIKLKVDALEIRRDSGPFGLSSLSRRNVHSCTFGQEGLVLVGGAVHNHRIRNPVAMPKEYSKTFPDRPGPQQVNLKTCKASQLLVASSSTGYYAVAPAAIFTRHSGTCRILGGAIHKQSVLQELKLGDILRLGSVGLVVSEMRLEEGEAPNFLGPEAVDCLQQDAAEVLLKDVETEGSPAAQSTDKDMEEDTSRQYGSRPRMSSLLSGVRTPTSISSRRSTRKFSQGRRLSVSKSISKTLSEERMCYVCFDDEDTQDDPLLAPCQCSGSTRFIHLNCLQTWSKSNQRSQVCIAVNPSGAPVCTVCKTAYKANVRTSFGNLVSLRAMSLKPPYLCFTVVTKHHGVTTEPLFSTKFYVSFDVVLDKSRKKGIRGLSVGRSHRCDMMLDCQTVSVMHGIIMYNNGKFFYKDTKSKNGSMLYLREPLYLPPGKDIVLKWGDAFVTITVQNTLFETLYNKFKQLINFGKEPPTHEIGSGRIAPNDDLEKLMALCRATSEIPANRGLLVPFRDRKRDDRQVAGMATNFESQMSSSSILSEALESARQHQQAQGHTELERPSTGENGGATQQEGERVGAYSNDGHGINLLHLAAGTGSELGSSLYGEQGSVVSSAANGTQHFHDQLTPEESLDVSTTRLSVKQASESLEEEKSGPVNCHWDSSVSRSEADETKEEPQTKAIDHRQFGDEGSSIRSEKEAENLESKN